jgi:hypothetical protein
VSGRNRWDGRTASARDKTGRGRFNKRADWRVGADERRTAVLKMRTMVPFSDAVARRVPSSDSARHASGPSCAATNLVRFTSYSSTRTCAERLRPCVLRTFNRPGCGSHGAMAARR